MLTKLVHSRIFLRGVGVLLVFFLVRPPIAPANGLFDDGQLEGRPGRMTGISGPTQSTRRVVVFGDSLSDNEGRLAAYTGGVVPPPLLYWRQRLSNGPLWTEYFTAALSLPLVSYAVAGARLHQYNNYGVIPSALSHLWAPPFAVQLAAFDQDGSRFDDQDWVFLWIGNNDFIFEPYPASGENYCDSIIEATSQLQSRGAQRIVIIGVSDVSWTPFSRRGGSRASIDELRRLIAAHNACVESKLRDLQSRHPHDRLDFITLSGIADHIMTHPTNYSLTNTDTPCLTGSTWPTITLPFPPIPPLIVGHFLGACPNQNRNFFWDAWHPNTVIHCIATLEVLKQLGQYGRVWRFDEDPVSKRCF